MAVKRVLLAPGASGNPEQLRRHVSLLGSRGLSVELVVLPRGAAERAVATYRTALGALPETTVIGGRSFGGRVASLLAAETGVAAVVLLSYPLHAPGRHESWQPRTAHWPNITSPVLLLSGEADPFARIDLLRRATAQLPNAKLVTYPRVGHDLAPVIDRALDEVAGFIAAET